MFVEEVMLEMPDAFPAAEFTEFMRRSRSLLTQPKRPAWSEFAGASNLIAWRFRAALEAEAAFAASWNHGGANVGFEELYVRERLVYAMFTSGVSCLESTVYAAYALASDPRVLGLQFGPAEQRNCRATSLKKALGTSLGAAGLKDALGRMIDAHQWNRWTTLRNRMAHRGNLPQVIVGTGGGLPPPARALSFGATSSTDAIDGDVSDLRALNSWLAETLRSLLVETTSIAGTA